MLALDEWNWIFKLKDSSVVCHSELGMRSTQIRVALFAFVVVVSTLGLNLLGLQNQARQATNAPATIDDLEPRSTQFASFELGGAKYRVWIGSRPNSGTKDTPLVFHDPVLVPMAAPSGEKLQVKVVPTQELLNGRYRVGIPFSVSNSAISQAVLATVVDKIPALNTNQIEVRPCWCHETVEEYADVAGLSVSIDGAKDRLYQLVVRQRS